MQRLKEDEREAESSARRGGARGYMGARMYMPEIGRFLAVDPLAEAFPTQSPYNFAYNNPINFRDPSGLAPEKEKGDRVLGTATNPGLENSNAQSILAESNAYFSRIKYEQDKMAAKEDAEWREVVAARLGGGGSNSSGGNGLFNVISKGWDVLVDYLFSVGKLSDEREKKEKERDPLDEPPTAEELARPTYRVKGTVDVVAPRGFFSTEELLDAKELFFDCWGHYQTGGGKPLFVNGATVDLGTFNMSSPEIDKAIKNRGKGSVNLIWYSGLQCGLAIGSVNFQIINNNTIQLRPDLYDFDLRNKWDWGDIFRNFETFDAGLLHGLVIHNVPVPFGARVGPSASLGGSFYMYFIGTTKINP